ncbi:MAG TPA: DNA polymerase III subunit delta [Pyrinomonadaceae bacterium]|jgi:DNA polymerase-3 subunit delta|nr:DNA polymerase III subunit delta [Pyrinomonadaceae bacterium]
MKSLTRPQLFRSLEDGKVDPLYLMIGSEAYLCTEAGCAIAETALRGTLLREFNESHFSLLTTNARSAVAAAEQLPMMSERRVITVNDFAKIREGDEEVLIRYIENPVQSSVVIFVARDLDKRRKLTKTLLDNCTVIDFPPVSDGEAKAWAKEHLKKLKVATDDRALTEVISLVGTDIQTLSSELEKLATAAGETKRIALDLVDDLIGRSRELSNFDLTDYLISRNRRKALEILHRLLDDGSEPVMLIGLIASNYHRLAIAKDLLTRKGKDAVFQQIRMPWKKQGEFLATLQKSTEGDIATGIQRIAAADLAIKTSQATPRLQLEMLVCELAA